MHGTVNESSMHIMFSDLIILYQNIITWISNNLVYLNPPFFYNQVHIQIRLYSINNWLIKPNTCPTFFFFCYFTQILRHKTEEKICCYSCFITTLNVRVSLPINKWQWLFEKTRSGKFILVQVTWQSCRISHDHHIWLALSEPLLFAPWP